MKTNDRNWAGNNNQPKTTEKPQQVNQPQNQTKNSADKKPTYIKDMPPIDGARPGVI